MRVLVICMLTLVVGQSGEDRIEYGKESVRYVEESIGNVEDSIVVWGISSKEIGPEESSSITEALVTELGKVLKVDKIEKRVESVEDAKEMWNRAMQSRIEQGNRVPILLLWECSRIGAKYRLRVSYYDLKKEGIEAWASLFPMVVVAASPVDVVPNLCRVLVDRLLGVEEKEYGSIVVESQPSGADILLDGDLVGQTPFRIDLISFGEHSVLLSKRGYATSVKLIVVYPGKTVNISSTLSPISGSLIAPPEKAPVYLVDEIVVRGEKIRDELFKVPKGIEILNLRDIEYSGAKDVPQLLSQVAGLSVIDKTGSGVSSSISIRGMDPTKYTLVTLDGIVINRADGEVNWGAIPLEIVKRIEVIKGGATTPYGGRVGGGGGVINIVTKEREKNKISLSTANGKDGGWAVTLSASDGWDLWLNTHGRKGNGWRVDEEYDIRTFYGKFAFPILLELGQGTHPSRGSAVVFSLDAVKQRSLFPGGLTEIELEVDPKQSGIDIEDKLWENMRLTSQYEVKGSESNFLFKFHTIPQTYKSTGLNNWELKGIEVGTSVEYGRKNRWTLLTEAELSNLGRTVFGIPETLICDDNSQSLIFRSLLEWEEKVFKIFTLTPGVKYELVGYRIQDRTEFPIAVKTIQEANLSPKFGLIWTSMVCDIFSSLERTIHLPKPYEKAKNIDLKPEMLTSVELGMRLRRTPIAASFSLFYVDIRDQILMKGVTFENSKYVAYHRGVEGELNYRMTDNLSLFVNHTFIEAKFKDVGLWIPQVPQTEGSAGVRLTYMPTYSLTVTYNWYGKSFVDLQNRPNWVVDPWTTLDFYFKYKLHPSFSFGLNVTNFTNTAGKSFGYEFQGEARYYPISPRGFRIEGSFEF